MIVKMETYFELVDKIKGLKIRRGQLTDRWNNELCWNGSKPRREEHIKKMDFVYSELKSSKEQLEAYQKEVGKETLQEWKVIYENRRANL